jgi:hypothetical protein
VKFHGQQLDNRHRAKDATKGLIKYHQEALKNCGWWLHICAYHAHQLREHRNNLADHREAIDRHNEHIEDHQERIVDHREKVNKKLKKAGIGRQPAPDEDDEHSDYGLKSDPLQDNQGMIMPDHKMYGGWSPSDVD